MTRVVARILAAASNKRVVDEGSDHTLLSTAVAADSLLGELDALATLISGLEVTDDALGAARAEVLADIQKRRGDDPALTATTLAAESIQPSRGDGRRGGIRKEVEAIELADVQAFWRAHFTAGNARLVMTGRADPALRAHIDKAFGALPAGDPPTQRPPGQSTVIGTLVMGDAPTSVALAVPAPPPSDPRFPAFLVLAARLAGDASGWSARYDPVALPDTLFVTGEVGTSEPAEPAAARIRADATTRLDKPLEPADVSAARERFAWLLDDGRERCKDDPRKLAIAQARRTQLQLGERDLGKALEAVSQDDLSDAAKLFDPKRTTTVIAGGKL
jgi:predicted Zn-dependent peptidase